MNLRNIISYLLLIVGLNFLCLNNQLFAFQNDTSLTAIFEMSIEELMNQEVSIATKSSQKLLESPANVTVITSEEKSLELVQSLTPGQSRLVSIRKVEGGKFHLEIAEKIVKESGTVNVLAMLNIGDERFNNIGISA